MERQSEQAEAQEMWSDKRKLACAVTRLCILCLDPRSLMQFHAAVTPLSKGISRENERQDGKQMSGNADYSPWKQIKVHTIRAEI